MTSSYELHRLQVQDLEIARLARQLAEVQAAREVRACQDRLEEAQARLQTLGEEHRQLGVRVRRLELDAATHAARQTELQGRLYGGTITSPREMDSCQAELELVRQRKDSSETEALDALMELEELEQSQHAQQACVAELGVELERERQKASEVSPELESRLEAGYQRRAQLEERIDGDALKLYEKLRKDLGTAVAEVTGDRCAGCRMELPAGVLRALQSRELSRCTNCQRILHRLES